MGGEQGESEAGEVSGDPPCLPSPMPTPEKAMATHSRALAWRIPGTGEPGGLPSMGSHSVGHD